MMIDHLSIGGPQKWYQKWHLDLPLLLLLLIFMILSLSILYSASDFQMALVYRQMRNFIIAFIVLFIVIQFNIYDWRRFALVIYLLALLLLLLVPWFGVRINGAQRWINLGWFHIQPSEVMKLTIPVLCAWVLSRGVLPPSRMQVMISAMIIAPPVMLTAVQPDLGTALLISTGGLAVLFMAGITWRYLVGSLLAVVLFAPVAWQFLLLDYHKRRILTLFSPQADPLGSGWNILQSKIAVGSGGWWGKGWSNGSQSHLDFLPEGHTDFIFAVFAEEMGFIGVSLLLLLYALLLMRGMWLSYQCRQLFGRLLGSALVLVIFVYLLVNVAMVQGLLPVVGVPLPLISYGGTSLVTLFACCGVLMALRYY